MGYALVVVSMRDIDTSNKIGLTIVVLPAEMKAKWDIFSAKSLELVSTSELFQSLTAENPGPAGPLTD